MAEEDDFVEVTFPSQGLWNLDILPRPVYGVESHRTIVERAGLDGKILIKTPRRFERPDGTSPGWVAFHLFPFELGFRLPLPPFTSCFLGINGLSPAQIRPEVWQVLWVLESLIKDCSISIDITMLQGCYDMYLDENKMLNLQPKDGTPILTWPLDEEDDWQNKYFFLNIPSTLHIWSNAENTLHGKWLTDGKFNLYLM